MSRDTTPEAASVRFTALAKLSPEDRLREALALSDLVTALASRQERPGESRGSDRQCEARTTASVTLEQFLSFVVQTLDSHEVPFMLTSSLVLGELDSSVGT